MGYFAGIGGFFWLLMTTLALLTPLMIYLIQRNTCQTRDELKKLNKNIEALHYLLGKQTGILANSPTKATPEEKPTTAEKPPNNTVTMTCEHCGKSFKYGTNHSGTYKPCPGCKKKILLK